MIRSPLMLIMLVFSFATEAKQHRSNAARHAFAREIPCPSTNKPKLPCPGYVLDHIIPLCAGGDDALANMQWQEYSASLVKDNEERRRCRLLKHPN